jgi:hypothetical protein
MTQQPHWTLDRRVPIGLIGALLVQSAGIVWWARGVEAEIDGQSNAKAELVRRVDTIEQRAERERVSERIAVIEVQIREQTALLLRIDQRLHERKP